MAGFLMQQILDQIPTADEETARQLLKTAIDLYPTEESSNKLVRKALIAISSMPESETALLLALLCQKRSLNVLLQAHAKNILSDYFKPLFHSDSWKSNRVLVSLEWFILKLEFPLDNLHYLLIPTIMTLVNDYEPKFKIQGCALLGAVVDKSTCHALSSTGIINVFQEALFKCTTYLDHPSLVAFSMNVLLDLSSKMTARESIKRLEFLELILSDAILQQIVFAGGKPEIQNIFLRFIHKLVKEMGAYTARYFKV
jgi:hypothetical protein